MMALASAARADLSATSIQIDLLRTHFERATRFRIVSVGFVVTLMVSGAGNLIALLGTSIAALVIMLVLTREAMSAVPRFGRMYVGCVCYAVAVSAVPLAVDPASEYGAWGVLGLVHFALLGWGYILAPVPHLQRVTLSAVGVLSASGIWLKFGAGTGASAVVLAILGILLSGLYAGTVGSAMAATQRARHDASVDELTGLLSRPALADAAAEFRASESAVLVAVIDLDGFKTINDTYGHSCGDGVLQTVAERLRTNLGADALAARMGGDEFCVLVPGTEVDQLAVERFELLATQLQNPMRVGSVVLRVKVSIGLTVVDRASDLDESIASADIAMYRNKGHIGSAVTRFDTSMAEAMAARVTLEQELAEALANGQICFVAQPIVRAYNRSPVAVELLARWDRDEGEEIGPAVFVPVLEEMGEVLALDRLALRAAAELLAELADHEHTSAIHVGINVSPAHLGADLAADIRAAVPEKYWRRLAIELVETAVISGDAQIADLVEIRAMGVHLLLDDFGSGYASLTHLRDLPVRLVKLDAGFARNLDTNQLHRTLVGGFAGIAHEFGLFLIIEGIETEAEFAAAVELGVGSCQGFLFARPTPLSQLGAVLRSLNANVDLTVDESEQIQVRTDLLDRREQMIALAMPTIEGHAGELEGSVAPQPVPSEGATDGRSPPPALTHTAASTPA